MNALDVLRTVGGNQDRVFLLLVSLLIFTSFLVNNFIIFQAHFCPLPLYSFSHHFLLKVFLFHLHLSFVKKKRKNLLTGSCLYLLAECAQLSGHMISDSQSQLCLFSQPLLVQKMADPITALYCVFYSL